MQRSVKRAMLALGLLAILPLSVLATVIHVPVDQITVQAAINASANGDTVLVAPGRYVENINFRAKRVVLASNYLLSGDPNDIWNTVLDGSNPVYADTASIIIIAGNQDSTTAVIGFTLTGGRGTKWRDVSDSKIYREGGAILTEGTSPSIKNNLIINNRANEKGSGVASAGGGGIRSGFGVGYPPQIIGNVFAYNQGLYGGAVVSFHCGIIFKNNVVWRNTGGQDFGGAGLWIWNNGSDASTVQNNTILENSTVKAGGGININNSVTDVLNNIIRGNSGAPPQISINGGGVAVTHNNIEGGYPGTANDDVGPQFDVTNLLLQATSPCVDSGNPNSAFNDRQDPVNPGFALFPALGTLRNDKGAYGGLFGCVFPLFTSKQFAMPTDSLDFGPTHLGQSVERVIRFTKQGYGPVTLESMQAGHTPAAQLYSLTTLPLTLATAPTSDSIRLVWQPLSAGQLRDTIRIYHYDTTIVSPLVVVVTGTAFCCEGTTGNVNVSGIVDVSDLSMLVSYLTASPPPTLACPDEANINAASIIDVSDLSMLVAYLTTPPGTVTLPACP